MKPNLNFYNEYQAEIPKEDRIRALSLFKKMSDAKPGLLQEAEVKIVDSADGSLLIFIKNISALDNKTANVIKNYINTIRAKNC